MVSSLALESAVYGIFLVLYTLLFVYNIKLFVFILGKDYIILVVIL